VPSEFQFDVFLSHNAKDKSRVRRLAERLRQAGLWVWLNEWSIRSREESEDLVPFVAKRI